MSLLVQNCIRWDNKTVYPRNLGLTKCHLTSGLYKNEVTILVLLFSFKDCFQNRYSFLPTPPSSAQDTMKYSSTYSTTSTARWTLSTQASTTVDDCRQMAPGLAYFHYWIAVWWTFFHTSSATPMDVIR